MRRPLTILLIIALGCLVAALASAGTPQVGALPVTLWCAVLAFALQWLTFSWAYLKQTETFFDLVGSLTYIAVILLALSLGESPDNRSLVLAGCVIIWATRLGSFLFLRIRADGGDRRFDRIKTRLLPFLQTWTLQGFWVVTTASCALAAISSGASKPIGAVAYTGLVLWVFGFSLEVIADTQKRRFRALAGNRGRFIRSGVWRFSQHPNYLGEILLWLGIAIIALPVLQGMQYFTLLTPVFVWVLLTRVSGIPLLQAAAKRRWGDDPAWLEYQANTPQLFPWIGRKT